MRRAAKVDKNHAELVKAFRELGYSVLSLARLGSGVPDALVAKDGKSALIEFKSAKGKLNKDQLDFVTKWHGAIEVARSVDDVIRIDALLQG